MKKLALLAITLVVLSVAVFAANKNSATINLRQAVTVGATALPAGEYKVEWTNPGADGKVTFLQGKKTVAVVPATIAAGENPQVNVLTSGEGAAAVLNGLRLRTANVTFENTTKSAH